MVRQLGIVELILAIAVSTHAPLCEAADETQVPENFQRENLVAWCIVPFDAKVRGPAERAEMIRSLGMRRVAYDWRAEHVPQFEEEILQYKKHDIEYFAFWSWHEAPGGADQKARDQAANLDHVRATQGGFLSRQSCRDRQRTIALGEKDKRTRTGPGHLQPWRLDGRAQKHGRDL